MAEGGNVNPLRNRKGETGNPPPKGARASALPDTNKRRAARHGKHNRWHVGVAADSLTSTLPRAVTIIGMQSCSEASSRLL